MLTRAKEELLGSFLRDAEGLTYLLTGEPLAFAHEQGGTMPRVQMLQRFSQECALFTANGVAFRVVV